MMVLRVIVTFFLVAPLMKASDLEKIAELSARQQSTVLLYNRLGDEVISIANGAIQHVTLPSGTKLTSKPALSPDRNSIAYTATVSGSRGFLAIQNLNTGEVARIEKGVGYDPTWSPNGKRLASAYIQELFITDVSSHSAAQTINLSAFGKDYNFSGPSWSSDGNHITIQALIDGHSRDFQPEVAVVDLNTGVAERLADGQKPAWSPHDNTIAFYDVDGKVCRRINYKTRMVTTLFTNRKLLGHEMTSVLTWSPDAQYLAYNVDAGIEGDQRTVYVFNIHDRRRAKLSSGDLELIDWR